MTQQLIFSLQLNNNITLDDFNWSVNEHLQYQLNLILSSQGERIIYLWGNAGSGKSHILQGLCHKYHLYDRTSIYLPLHILKNSDVNIIEGLNTQSLIAIDDIDAISQHNNWEEALFNLYNQVHETENSILLISNDKAPMFSNIALPDLRSRLSAALVMHVHELNDDGKVLMLQQQAKKRGFVLSHAVSWFLIQRCARNMHDLQSLLEQLDHASLAAKRKITIPFIKSIFDI